MRAWKYLNGVKKEKKASIIHFSLHNRISIHLLFAVFLRGVNSLIHFSLINHSLYSLFWYGAAVTAFSRSLSSPLSVCLSVSLPFSSSLFLQRSKGKDKTGFPDAAILSCFPIHFTSKAQVCYIILQMISYRFWICFLNDKSSPHWQTEHHSVCWKQTPLSTVKLYFLQFYTWCWDSWVKVKIKVYLNIDEKSVFVYTEPALGVEPGLCLHPPRGHRMAFHTEGGNISLRIEEKNQRDKESLLRVCVCSKPGVKYSLRDNFTPEYAELWCLSVTSLPVFILYTKDFKSWRQAISPSRGGGGLGCLRWRLPEAAGRLLTSLCVFVLFMRDGPVCTEFTQDKVEQEKLDREREPAGLLTNPIVVQMKVLLWLCLTAELTVYTPRTARILDCTFAMSLWCNSGHWLRLPLDACVLWNGSADVLLRVPTGYVLSAAWPVSWTGEREEYPPPWFQNNYTLYIIINTTNRQKVGVSISRIRRMLDLLW